MSVKDELKQFCQTTSVKGVPRAVRSQAKILTIIWTVAVTCFLVMAVYQTVLLILEYRRYLTVTTVTQRFVDFPVIPDVIVCNLNPLSTLSENKTEVPSLKDFQKRLDDLSHCNNCSDKDSKFRKKLKDTLSSPAGYYQYIGREAVESVSHTLEDLIVNCQIIAIDGVKKLKVSCSGNVNITQHISIQHYNCYKIHPHDLVGIGLSVVSYIDDFDVRDAGYFNLEIDSATSAGILIDLVEDRTLWTLFSSRLWLSPGTFNRIKFSIEKHESLPAPYGDCKEDEFDGEIYKMPYKRALSTCLSICLETIASKNCSCKDLESLAFLEEQGHAPDLPYCGNISLPMKDIANNMKCASEVREVGVSPCFNVCPLRCSQMIFKPSITSVPWPHGQNLGTFYEKYIRGRRYEKHFKSAWEEAQTNGSKAIFLDLIRKNFVKSNIYLSELKYTHIRDEPKMGLLNLLSQVGAILNWWSGITVVIVIELIELAIRFCISKNDSVNAVPAESANPMTLHATGAT